jgi:hypothetical protein
MDSLTSLRGSGREHQRLLFRLTPPCNPFGIPPRAFYGALDFVLCMLPLKVRQNGIAMRELSCVPGGVVVHATSLP